jgi:hypothetical protein
VVESAIDSLRNLNNSRGPGRFERIVNELRLSVDRGSLVPFVGAGVSMEFGLTSCGEFLRRAAEITLPPIVV